MARLTDDAIVLRRWEYSETSQTVAALSRTHGVVRGLAKGALRSGSAFSGGFEPMTRGHLGWLVKAGRELAILTEWMPSDVYWSSRQTPDANAAAIFAIDQVARLLTDEDPHPDVYDALDRVLREMTQPPGVHSHLLRFQWTLLQAVGWTPVVAHDVETGGHLELDQDVLGFRPSAGGVTSHAAESDWRVRRSTIERLQSLDGGTPIAGDPVTERSAALLAAWTRHVLGEESEAMRLAFPQLR